MTEGKELLEDIMVGSGRWALERDRFIRSGYRKGWWAMGGGMQTNYLR